MLINSYSQPPTPRPTKTGNEPQSHSSGINQAPKGNHNVPNGNTLKIDGNTNTAITKESPDNRTEGSNDKAPSNWWIIAFTGVLAIVAVFQFSTMIAQYLAMREQADLLRKSVDVAREATNATKEAAIAAKKSADSLPITERAYLFVDSIEWPNKKGPSSLGEFNKSTTIITIVNAGRTPAILQNFDSELIIKKNDYPSKDNPNFTKSLEFPKGIITKSDGKETFTHQTAFSHTVISEDDFSHSILLCYGYIRYEDIFRNIHATGFCYEISPRQSHGRFRISENTDLNYHT